MRRKMDHTTVSETFSVTLYIWQDGAKEKYCNFATFNRIVDIKTRLIVLSQQSQIYKTLARKESKPIINF